MLKKMTPLFLISILSFNAFSAQSSLVFNFPSNELLEDFIDGDEDVLTKKSENQAEWSGNGDIEMLSVDINEADSICYNGTVDRAKTLVQTLVENSDCNGEACLARLDDDETVDPEKTYIKVAGRTINLKYTYYGETEYSGEYTISKCD